MDSQLLKFLEIEKKYDLYTKTVEGENFWVYSRFTLWRDEIRKEEFGLSKGESSKKEKNIKQTVCNIAGILKNSIFKSTSKKRNVDLLVLNHERRIQNKGYYICKYTEEISDAVKNSVAMERPYSGRHYQPVRTRNLVYNDRYVVLSNLYAYMHRSLKTPYYKRICAQIEEIIKEPLKELMTFYHIELDMEHIVKNMAHRHIVMKKKKKYYTAFLDKINPKAIIEVVSYSTDHMLINEIAHSKNIPTIELQHGAISSWHCAYRYNTSQNIKQLPDKYLLFGDYWKKFIQWPIDERNIVSVGFPYFEHNVKKIDSNKNEEYFTILFLSQRTIGEKLGEYAYACYCHLDQEKYRIIYKLHPSEYGDWKERYPFFSKCDKMLVVDNGEKDLYEYFAESHMQVGVYSTSIYEGIGFGLPTCIYYIEGSYAMQTLCEAGKAGLVKTPDDLERYILQMENQKVDIDFFWKKNASENLLKEIYSVLEENDRN